MSLTLTVDEIRDLAKFAGFCLKDNREPDEDEIEITIEDCPPIGVKDDDGSIIHTKHIAFYEDVRDDGCMPLGKQITE